MFYSGGVSGEGRRQWDGRKEAKVARWPVGMGTVASNWILVGHMPYPTPCRQPTHTCCSQRALFLPPAELSVIDHHFELSWLHCCDASPREPLRPRSASHSTTLRYIRTIPPCHPYSSAPVPGGAIFIRVKCQSFTFGGSEGLA